MRRCWRLRQPAPDIVDVDIGGLLHVITSTGSGPIVWNRLRALPDFASTDMGKALKDRYHTAILFAAMQAEALERIIDILKPAGITPIIFKGWSVAQFYAVPDLRPHGDIDLCVPPGRYEETARLLAEHASLPSGTKIQFDGQVTGLSMNIGLPSQVTQVDLHRNLNRYLHCSSVDVFARSQLIPIGATYIRILAPEDHLRLLCLHFLGHGAWRPIWLCDIGAVLEKLPADFDWELCLGDTPLRRHWVLTAINLAHELLAADLDKLPKQNQTVLPQWLKTETLKQWSRPFEAHAPNPLFSYILRNMPLRFLQEFIMVRWPNPILATYRINARFDEKPRWPYQIAYFVKATFSYLIKHSVSK